MNETLHNPDTESLRAELQDARRQMDSLADELRTVEAELAAHEERRRQFGLVEDACRALETLESEGASSLFWDGFDGVGERQTHLHVVRGRIEAFEKVLDEVQARRSGLLEELEQREWQADSIAGEMLDAERLAEESRHEWVIERDGDDIPVRPSLMPWARTQEEDQRLRKNLLIALLISLLLGLIFPFIELPIPEKWEVLEEQQRLTQLIREELPTPAPVEIVEARETIPEETKPTERQEEPQLAEESAPAAEAAPAAKKAETASRGILAFREQFSALAEHDTVARLGANATIQKGGDASAGLPERSMVTTQAPGSSGGINVAALSRDTGGTGDRMGGVAIQRATSTIGNGGGSDRPLAGGGPGLSRTDEEIQIVFDRHKAALYRLYNRALRKNPTLKGQIVLRLTIEPDGSVSSCELKSSDMKAPDLAGKVVERVRTFDFGAKDGVPPVTIVYPIDFLPAS